LLTKNGTSATGNTAFFSEAMGAHIYALHEHEVGSTVGRTEESPPQAATTSGLANSRSMISIVARPIYSLFGSDVSIASR
jgi:hypothetical protein